MGALDQYFLTGQWIQGIIAIYTSRAGDFFYGAVVLCLSIVPYMKTRRIDYILVVWALVSGALHVFVPTAVNTLAKVLIALGLASVLYKVFVRE